MAETQITADWAWISKDPAEGIGYGVLATSAANVDFRPFIGRYVPGSPNSSTPADAPDAPPWVTFGPMVTKGDGVLMSVSVRDPWQDRDHAGRPVWPQRLLVMRFADLAAAQASYQTMWGFAQDAPVPRDQPEPLRLVVAGQLTAALAATIEHYGLPQLAALAAALLDGPVVVSEAAGLRRDERLALLDAIAALLPYGFRADLSASSVVDNTVEHGIRLAFASYPSARQQLRSLREPAPQPGSERAGRYQAMLAEKATARGLQAVVDHLWTFRAPCSFDYPDDAQTILSELDFYGGFSRALRERRASRAQVLKFFADPARAQEHWAAFDPQMRENAISPYLADRDVEVTVAILRGWEFVRHDVVTMINDHLGARGAGFGVWCLQAAAAVPANGPGNVPGNGPGNGSGNGPGNGPGNGSGTPGEVADQLLGKMLVPVGLNAEDRSGRIAILVQLLRQCRVPAAGQFRYSCDELRFGDLGGWQAHLVRELLGKETAGPAEPGPPDAAPADRAGAWITWLCGSPFGATPQRPSWLAALDFATSPSAGADAAASARGVIRQDAAWTVVLLRLAERSGCYGRLLKTAARDLMDLAATLPGPAQPGSHAAGLRDELDRNLWQLRVAPATVAAVDVARVLLGGTPRHLAAQLTQARLTGYVGALSPALAPEIMTARRVDVEQAFLRQAMSRQAATGLTDAGVWLLNTWAVDPDRVTGLCDFIAAQDPAARPYDESLSDAYWDALASRPELAGYAAGQQLATATRESALAPLTAFRRIVTESGVTSTPLARACYKARRAGLRPTEIVTALASGGADRIAPDRLDDVLGEFQQLLLCSYLGSPRPNTELDPRQAAEAERLACQALIAWGGLGEGYGEQFRQQLMERWRGAGRIQRRLVRVLRKAGGNRGHLDRGDWVFSVVQTGIGAPRPPWHQRWLAALRRRRRKPVAAEETRARRG
jgi:hypothetical protein